MRILDVGCGNNKYKEEGAKVYGIDIGKTPDVDKVWDGEKDRIPYPDNYFDKIVSFGALEHIGNFKNVMEEIWRVAKPKAKVIIVVPYFRSGWAFSENHKLFFKIDSFQYLQPDHYGNWDYKARFNILKNKLDMIMDDKSHVKFLRIFNPLINLPIIKILFSELLSHIIIPQKLYFELEVVKESLL